MVLLHLALFGLCVNNPIIGDVDDYERCTVVFCISDQRKANR